MFLSLDSAARMADINEKDQAVEDRGVDGTGVERLTARDEAALFASPLPMTGERKTTKRKEIWVGDVKARRDSPDTAVMVFLLHRQQRSR